MTTKTKSQRVAEDVSALIRAKHPLLWVVTREEARAEQYLAAAAAKAGYTPHTWDVADGSRNMDGTSANFGEPSADAMLRAIGEAASRPVITDSDGKPVNRRDAWIMRDLAPWVRGDQGPNPTQRILRNLARALPSAARSSAQAVIVLTPVANVPEELQGHATVINWPLPDRDEIAATLDGVLENLPDDMRQNAAPNGTRDAAIDAACGLTQEEAQACYAKSIVQTGKIEPATVAAEKKRIVSKTGLLQWFDPIPGGLEAVGGLDQLKGYLFSRRSAYTPEARAYGLPTPKGALLVGPSGTGKSYTSKAVATAWNVPLLKLDLGAIKSKFVGESEQNLRKAFDIIKAIGRCVVWLDEIEKAMAGATDGAADGGVSKDALGALLNFMQEERGESFWIATSNDASQLPPELIARFDTTWFVDLPSREERAQIIAATLRSIGRGDAMDAGMCAAVAHVTEGFNGRELAALVDNALYLSFEDGQRQVEARDLIAARKGVVPISETAKEKVEQLRTWAATRARRASTPQQTATSGRTSGPNIDI